MTSITLITIDGRLYALTRIGDRTLIQLLNVNTEA